MTYNVFGGTGMLNTAQPTRLSSGSLIIYVCPQ